MRAVVLTYHSHRMAGADYAENDHVALAQDLRAIAAAGARIAPLHDIARAVAGNDFAYGMDAPVVGISFDDGPRLDVDDFVHPRFGPQRSFANILRDFAATAEGARQERLHATSFVIASREARRAIAGALDIGADAGAWLDDGWWKAAVDEGLLAVENHSWDHLNDPRYGDAARREDFRDVYRYDEAERQIHRANDAIASVTGRAPTLFAYPFGRVNDHDYLPGVYFPNRGREIGLTAAFATGGKAVAVGRAWAIPRYVCGHHWKNPAGLRAILAAA